jgi:hypothetical protein
MNMDASFAHDGRYEQRERDALRLLCSNLIKPTTRVELAGLLDASTFDVPVHRAVLEEISALGDVTAAQLRKLLPERVRKRGFADFDLKKFLGAETANEAQVEELFASVLELIEMRHGDDSGMAEA